MNNTTQDAFSIALPPELWEITASYSFFDLFSQTKGDLRPVPAFLCVGCEATLQLPILQLQNQEITSELLALFDSRMPHLRKVDLTGAELDGKLYILKNQVRKLFPTHPDIEIVSSPVEIVFRRALSRAIEKSCAQHTAEATQLTAEKSTLVAAQAVRLRAPPVPGFFTRIFRRITGSTPVDPEKDEFNKRAKRIATIALRLQEITTHLRLSEELLQKSSAGTLPHIPELRYFSLCEKGDVSSLDMSKNFIILLNPHAPVEAKEEAKTFFRDLHTTMQGLQMQYASLVPAAAPNGTEKRLNHYVRDTSSSENIVSPIADKDRHAEMMHFTTKELTTAKLNGAITEVQHRRLQEELCSPNFMNRIPSLIKEFQLDIPNPFRLLPPQ